MMLKIQIWVGEKLIYLNPFFPMFPFDPPENIRKRLVFRYFQGDQKGTLGKKRLRAIVHIKQKPSTLNDFF